MSRQLRLSLLTEIPAPFRIPLFNALADRVDVRPRVLFVSRSDPRRTHYVVYANEFRFDYRVLRGFELQRLRRWIVFNRGVVADLRHFDPEVVVVGGWNQPAFWEAAAWAKARSRPLVTWVESTVRDARSGSWPLEGAKRALVRASAGFLVPGSASADYLESFGVRRDRIAVAPNAVDAEIFGRAAVDRSERAGCRFLYVGRFDPEKGLDLLLRAFEGVPGELWLVGSGREEERLRSLAGDRVRFLGRRARDELPEVYAAADVFVLPSRSEQWGMVLNEAATAGLPLVASDAAGAAYELVEDGVNGFRVPSGDESVLRSALERFASDPSLRAAAGARSREIAARFTPAAWASAVAELARNLVS